VSDTHDDVRLVGLDTCTSCLRFTHGSEVLGDKLPSTAEWWIGVDDLIDWERDVVCQRRTKVTEVAGVVGELTHGDRSGFSSCVCATAVVVAAVVVATVI